MRRAFLIAIALLMAAPAVAQTPASHQAEMKLTLLVTG